MSDKELLRLLDESDEYVARSEAISENIMKRVKHINKRIEMIDLQLSNLL